MHPAASQHAACQGDQHNWHHETAGRRFDDVDAIHDIAPRAGDGNFGSALRALDFLARFSFASFGRFKFGNPVQEACLVRG